jgi:NAD(P)-dependent dehydrogenase (short-subunit alcohol dehydrogenase family)
VILAAAVMATPYEETKDGFESQMAINYTGHFLLTHLLLPQLIAGSENFDGKNVRIVNVSSCAHYTTDIDFDDFHCKWVEFFARREQHSSWICIFRKFYYPADAYAKSKLAQVYFTKHLEVIFKERGLKIQAHAPHPGIVNTGLFEHSTNNYIPWFKEIFYKVSGTLKRVVEQTLIHSIHYRPQRLEPEQSSMQQ